MQWLLESWNGRQRGCSWCPPISLQQSWFYAPYSGQTMTCCWFGAFSGQKHQVLDVRWKPRQPMTSGNQWITTQLLHLPPGETTLEMFYFFPFLVSLLPLPCWDQLLVDHWCWNLFSGSASWETQTKTEGCRMYQWKSVATEDATEVNAIGCKIRKA